MMLPYFRNPDHSVETDYERGDSAKRPDTNNDKKPMSKSMNKHNDNTFTKKPNLDDSDLVKAEELGNKTAYQGKIS